MKEIPEEIRIRLKFKKVDEEIPTVLDIDYELRPCEDCGKRIGRREIHSTLAQTPRPHWKHECKNCRCYRNPVSGEFDLTSPAELVKVIKANISKENK